MKNDVAISHYLHTQNYDKLIRQFMMEESKLKDWFMDRHWKKHAFDIEIVSCKTLQPKFYDRWNEIILLYHLQYCTKWSIIRYIWSYETSFLSLYNIFFYLCVYLLSYRLIGK